MQLDATIPIFPCRSDKSPLIRGGFKGATTDAALIQRWWKTWPNALIGVPTGAESGVLVIDVDPDGREWYEAHAQALSTQIHETPRGLHLLYSMPNLDVRCGQNRPSPGVDVRANGGYIVWWPSHGYSVVEAPLSAPPQWLLDRLTIRHADAA